MIFQEYKPVKLNKLVHSIYERKVTSPMKVQFLPDNNITLIFNIGEKIEMAKGENIDSKVFNPTEIFCFISGLHTRPLYFQMDGLHSIGLILHPSAIKVFFGIPVKELKDQVIAWEFREEMDLIEGKLKSIKTFPERAYWLEDYFYKKAKLNKAGDLHLAIKLKSLVNQLKQDAIQGQRPDIARYSGYSKMHTNRIFKDWLGLPPGKLLKYEQFQDSIKLIHETNMSLTQIAFECGFYDQAHFNRVFQEFARMTPGEYRKNKSPLPGILPW